MHRHLPILTTPSTSAADAGTMVLVAEVEVSSAALPADVEFRRMAATERLSEPYRVEVEVATADVGVDLKGALRQRALVMMRDGAQRARLFDGIVERARFVGHTGTHAHVRLTIVPVLALLAHRTDSRIFQEQSPVDVIKAVLAEAGADERVEWRLLDEPGPREYLVQYRETDLNFVQRLCEDDGIFFFFEHSQEGHTLVFADHPDAFAPQDALPETVLSVDAQHPEATDAVEVFAREHRLRPSTVLLRDFDPITPQVKPEGTAAVPAPLNLSVYEYPAGLRTGDGQAERRAAARLKELRRDADVCFGESRAVGLCPGAPFRMVGASEAGMDGTYVCTELRTEAEQGIDGGDNASCENDLMAIPAGADFAPPRRARRPTIRGIQTAIVTGATNEQQAIHTDEYGRIKVRFHWDRAGVGDDKSSCWVRVGQLGLGGSMIIPRVGWEVAVTFLGGDPDRPVVTGRLYNGKQRPLIDVKSKATVGAFKSLSTPGAAGANELKMDDRAGSQGFGLSSAKDMNTFVGADKTETVGANETHSVASNLGTTVGGADAWDVGGNQSISVGNALQTSVGGAQSVTISGSDTYGCVANYIEAVGARSYTVNASRITMSNGVRTLVSGAFTRTVGGLQLNIAAGAIQDGMASSYVETVGAIKGELVHGDSAENVAGDKTLTSSAAELHGVTNLTWDAATVDRTVGGVHGTQAAANYEVSAPEIALVGGVGHFTGGGSSIKLNGGPITVKGSAITIKTALLRKTAGSVKLGT